MTPAGKMSRRAFLRGAAGTALLLAGCGRTESPAASPAPETLPVVRLWGIGGIDEATHRRIEARLDALAREKLGLSVKLTMVTRSSYNERLNIAFLQGEAPDLFPIYQQSAFDSLYDSGCLRNLHGYIDEDYLNSLRIPRPLWGCTRRDGDYYGVIQYSETMQFTTCQMRQETADALSIPQGDRLWSWNELSSSTAMSSGDIFGVSVSSGCPILPPSHTRRPAVLSISDMSVVVVVFPSDPVTAMVRHGQRRKNSSISLVISAPLSAAFTSCGVLGSTPGVRKMRSKSRLSR